MRRLGRWSSYAGLLALQCSVAVAYLSRGTWWHFLLHQLVGWGVGLSTVALIAVWTRYRVPAVAALLSGQLVSIVPDLQFRYARMPHDPSMDLWLGHISIHTGPSPVLVALGSLLLGGWGFVAVAYGRRRTAAALAAGGLALVTVACVASGDVPQRLEDYPLDTPRVLTGS